MKIDKPIISFDLETTGINKIKDRIIEIDMIKVFPDGSEQTFYSLINPDGREIDPSAFEAHGISKEDLVDSPTFAEIHEEIFEFIGDSDFSGYNIERFDIPLLCEEFARCGKILSLSSRRLFDTFRIWTWQEGRSLADAYRYFIGEDFLGAHQATEDNKASLAILRKQWKKYSLDEYGLDQISKRSLDSKGEGTSNIDPDGKFIKTKEGKVIFSFGKHRGKTVKEVFDVDENYFNWIIDKGEFSIITKLIAKNILNKLKS